MGEGQEEQREQQGKLREQEQEQGNILSKGADNGAAAPLFPRFGELPGEIRNMIWERSMPDDKPEVHHMWPMFPFNEGGWPMVDIAWPAMMHTCREARQICAPQLRMRNLQQLPPPAYSLNSRPRLLPAEVPCRPFRTDLDVLHLGSNLHSTYLNEQWRSGYAAFVRTVRHLSVDMFAAQVPRTNTWDNNTHNTRIVEFVRRRFAPETIAFHVSLPGRVQEIDRWPKYEYGREPFSSTGPTGTDDADFDVDLLRRVRMRRLTDAEAARTLFFTQWDGFRCLEHVLEDVRKDIEDPANQDIAGLSSLRIYACTYEENYVDDAGRPGWRPRGPLKMVRMMRIRIIQLLEDLHEIIRNSTEDPKQILSRYRMAY